MKVSNLYIAQVKQKYDIIECENYNKPKSEDAKQQQCPLEKEKGDYGGIKVLWGGLAYGRMQFTCVGFLLTPVFS